MVRERMAVRHGSFEHCPKSLTWKTRRRPYRDATPTELTWWHGLGKSKGAWRQASSTSSSPPARDGACQARAGVATT